jgi:hypothetical protein
MVSNGPMNEDSSTPAEPMPAKEPVSARKAEANRENSTKSTGPQTHRGKSRSSQNARTHGLRAESSIFVSAFVMADPGLKALHADLLAKYNSHDVRARIFVEQIVMECWRQKQAQRHEIAALMEDKTAHLIFRNNGHVIENVRRYALASQKNLFRALELLDRDLKDRTDTQPETAAEEPAEGPDCAAPAPTSQARASFRAAMKTVSEKAKTFASEWSSDGGKDSCELPNEAKKSFVRNVANSAAGSSAAETEDGNVPGSQEGGS